MLVKKKIDSNLEMMRGQDDNIMKDSLVIKKSMLKGILAGTVIFCFFKTLDYGVNNNLDD